LARPQSAKPEVSWTEAIEAFHLAFRAQLSNDPNKVVVKGAKT